MTTPTRPTVTLKPLALEAYQWLGESTWMVGEGAQVAHKGDWVLTDLAGRRHVFSDAALRAMCEPIGAVGRDGR